MKKKMRIKEFEEMTLNERDSRTYKMAVDDAFKFLNITLSSKQINGSEIPYLGSTRKYTFGEQEAVTFRYFNIKIHVFGTLGKKKIVRSVAMKLIIQTTEGSNVTSVRK